MDSQTSPSGDVKPKSRFLPSPPMALKRCSGGADGLPSRKTQKLCACEPRMRMLLSVDPSDSTRPRLGRSKWMPSSLTSRFVVCVCAQPSGRSSCLPVG